MKRNIIRLMTLCTVAVLALASCKKDNKPQGNVPENGFLATVEANQGNGGRTHLVGSDVLWNAGDQIVVRNGDGLTATYRLTAGENTTEGTFLSSEDDNDFFQPTYTAIYPATGNTITGEGTATITLPATQSYVANSFANGAMPMMAVSGEQTLAFKNMLGGICFPMVGDNLTVTRLVLTSNSATDHLSGVFSADYNNGQPTLTYTSGGANSITLDCGAGVTLSSTATDFTIMLPAGSLANGFTLQAYDGTTLLFEKSNTATLGADFIARSAIKKVNQNLQVGEAQFAGLTFEAKVANSSLTFTADNTTPAITMEYSTDGETWNEYTSGTAITLTNIGDKVMFRGDNETICGSNTFYDQDTGDSYEEPAPSTFSSAGECYIYGNVMSLLDKENFTTATTVPAFAFMRLFAYTGSSIYNHPNYPIVLPATTLAEGCYKEMFSGCTSLTTAPELPATTLAEYCYTYMFSGCTSLTTAPELPATTAEEFCYDGMFSGCTSLTTAPELPATMLAGACYRSMFDGCTSLTTAPELPATMLVGACYSGMFFGCTSLTTAPELPATMLADVCYREMFRDCTSLTTAPELPATTLVPSCYQGMFSGCTSLTTAPELPATTLAWHCYQHMFSGCENLTTAPELPVTTLAEYCYWSMFSGCTSLTTAPELPATTLAQGCYEFMFAGCTNLNYIKCLATNISAYGCTSGWLNGVSSTGTFVKHPSMNSWTTGDDGIPSGWTVVDAEL